MLKNYEKFIFLLIVIAVAFFARWAYPLTAAFPQLSTADQTQIAAPKGTPPFLVLPPLPATDSSTPSTLSSADGIAVADSPEDVPDQSSGSTTSVSFFSRVANTPIPSFSEEASLVADLTSGTSFSSVNADVRWPTASLTKLMTATVILDNVDQNAKITITPEMFAADPDETTLVIGGTYSVPDLLHVMLMPSSNVAAEAMADYFGHARFMQMMNERAQEWGMSNTYFDDPSGISAANESTANDLLILAQHVYNDYPEILSITDTHQTTITELNTGKKVLVTSINDFAGEPNFIGGKTGHTTEAGGNLLSIFKYRNNPVIIIVLGTTDRFGDTSELFSWFKTNFK